MKHSIIFIALIALVAANGFLKNEDSNKAVSLLNYFIGDFTDGVTASAPSGTYAGTF